MASTRESCSTSVTEITDGSHQYTIKGYSLAKGMGPGMYMSSDAFNVGGYDWAIHFYPDGQSAMDNSAYVSVYVVLASKEAGDVKATYKLTLIDQSGRGKHVVVECSPYKFNPNGRNMWCMP